MLNILTFLILYIVSFGIVLMLLKGEYRLVVYLFYKVEHFFYNIKLIPIAFCVNLFMKIFFSCDIPYQTNIGHNTFFPHHALGVVIGKKVKIGNNCKIQQGTTIGEKANSCDVPIIGNNVFIGANSTIIGNNTVNETVTDTITISEPTDKVVVEDNIKEDTNTITESVIEETVEEITTENIVEENTITAEPVIVEETEPEVVEDTNIEEVVTETVEETTEPEIIVEVDEPVELNDEIDAEPVTEELVEVEEINEQVEDTTNTKLAYTEEELNTMSKEDLQEICDTYGISYRKNNSISTLVGLIMEYQTKED